LKFLKMFSNFIVQSLSQDLLRLHPLRTFLAVTSVSHPVPFGMTLYGPRNVAAVGSDRGIFGAVAQSSKYLATI
jgi:uncharacterized membrane protein